MKTLFAIPFVCLCFWPTGSIAGDVKIENAYITQNSRSENPNTHVVFTVSWNNSWRNARNHDAAWIFMKLVGDNGGYQHIRLEQGQFEVVDDGGVRASVAVPEDGIGLFVHPAENHRGAVRWRIKIKVNEESLGNTNVSSRDLFVEAVEMVFVPEGRFTLGDPDPAALNFSSFFKSDANGNPDGLYEITASNQVIEVGPKNGALYYQTQNATYQGDKSGPVPATFPNGFDAFYIMKYETRQGQYANFLNTLSASQSHMRVPFGGKGYDENRGSIRLHNGRYHAEAPERPANYITWDDGAAFADWAGLRPMTELEYTKAARGPGTPVAHEFPWNTNSKESLERFVNRDGDLEMAGDISESQLTEANRHVFGASYYWVMDLAGSVWEKCITIGDEIGRAYTGSHGDGRITGYGDATNEDWPSGINETGGYGYRGGGFYYNDQRHTEFNPHSPIAYRPFGSWAGGTRSVAYSNRYVRTAP